MELGTLNKMTMACGMYQTPVTHNLMLKSILDLIQSAILLVALNTSTQNPLKQTILSTMQYQTLVRIELSATQLMMPRLLKESLIINGLGKRRRSQYQYHIQVLNVDWIPIW
jgi:hypothetical protein